MAEPQRACRMNEPPPTRGRKSGAWQRSNRDAGTLTITLYRDQWLALLYETERRGAAAQQALEALRRALEREAGDLPLSPHGGGRA